MKKLVLVVCCIVAMSVLSGCYFEKVPAGNVGVKVYLLGASKGVDHEVLSPGRYWIGWNRDLFIFPTYTITYNFTKSPHEGKSVDESISFQTSDGLSISADVGVSYRIKPDKVADVFQKYRKGTDEITSIFLRNMIRDAFVESASTRKVEDVYGAGKSELLTTVTQRVQKQVEDIGIVVEKIFVISDLRLPDGIVKSINEKLNANQIAQQKENELRQAEAEAKKVIATAEGAAKSTILKAEAEAKAIQLKAAALTPNIVLYEAIQQWDGKLPMFLGQTGTPLLNIKDIIGNASAPVPAEKK